MTDEEIDALHAKLRRARGAFEEVQGQAEGLVKRLKDVLRGFEHNDYLGGGAIVRPGFKPGVSTWPDDVPTSGEIVEVLTRWHEARAALVASYDALPEAEKKHVAAVPKSARDR